MSFLIQVQKRDGWIILSIRKVTIFSLNAGDLPQSLFYQPAHLFALIHACWLWNQVVENATGQYNFLIKLSQDTYDKLVLVNKVYSSLFHLYYCNKNISPVSGLDWMSEGIHYLSNVFQFNCLFLIYCFLISTMLFKESIIPSYLHNYFNP